MQFFQTKSDVIGSPRQPHNKNYLWSSDFIVYCHFSTSYWTPITKITKQFPTSRIKIFGIINQFPLALGYSFTIAKCQGNNNIGIHTVVHLNKKALSRREQYVAFSRSDKLENLHIVGNFTDPWFKEEERRKKKFPQLITEDRVCNAFQELEKKEVELIWKPLYKFPKESLKLVFHNVNSLMPHLEDIKMDYSTMAADVCFFFDSRSKPSDNVFLNNFVIKDQILMKTELKVPGGILILVKPHNDIKIIKKVVISVLGSFNFADVWDFSNQVPLISFYLNEQSIFFSKF